MYLMHCQHRLTRAAPMQNGSSFGAAARMEHFVLDPQVHYLNHGSYGAALRSCFWPSRCNAPAQHLAGWGLESRVYGPGSSTIWTPLQSLLVGA